MIPMLLAGTASVRNLAEDPFCVTRMEALSTPRIAHRAGSSPAQLSKSSSAIHSKKSRAPRGFAVTLPDTAQRVDAGVSQCDKRVATARDALQRRIDDPRQVMA